MVQMARKAHQIEIDKDSSDEEIELVILAAQSTSDVNVLRNAAKATVIKNKRERAFRIRMFNAQETARVKAQGFQEAQITRLIGAVNIDDDQKRSLGQSLTASQTLILASSSSQQAGYTDPRK